MHSHMVVMMQTLDPHSLICSFSSRVLSAPNVGGWVLPLLFIHSWQIFPAEELNTNMMSGGLMLIVEGFFWMLCSRETHLMVLRLSLHLSGSYLRCYKVSYTKITVINSISEMHAGCWWETNNQCIGVLRYMYTATTSSQACRSGLGLSNFMQTKHAHERLLIHVHIKTSKNENFSIIQHDHLLPWSEIHACFYHLWEVRSTKWIS